MPRRPEPAPTPFALATNAAIRRILADRRISQAEIARDTDLGATYIAERLRDEKSFTLTDMEVLGRFFNFDPQEFLLTVSAEMRRNVGARSDDAASDPFPVLTAGELAQRDLDRAAHTGTPVADQETHNDDDARPSA